MNNNDRALTLMEEAIEVYDGMMPYISLNMPCFNYLREEPRFIELLKRMNLPLN
jgi:hypothetical protein